MSLNEDVSNILLVWYKSKQECKKNGYVKVAQEEDRIKKLDKSKNTIMV